MFTLFQNFAELCLKNDPFFLISRLTFEKLHFSSRKWVRAWYTFWSGVGVPGLALTHRYWNTQHSWPSPKHMIERLFFRRVFIKAFIWDLLLTLLVLNILCKLGQCRAYGLTPCVARPLVATLLTVQDKGALAFHEDAFRLPVLS